MAQIPQSSRNPQEHIPLYVYPPRNNRRLIFFSRWRRRLNGRGEFDRRSRMFLLAVSLAFVTGVIIGAAFF